jgi:hypothetical protein
MDSSLRDKENGGERGEEEIGTGGGMGRELDEGVLVTKLHHWSEKEVIIRHLPYDMVLK